MHKWEVESIFIQLWKLCCVWGPLNVICHASDRQHCSWCLLKKIKKNKNGAPAECGGFSSHSFFFLVTFSGLQWVRNQTWRNTISTLWSIYFNILPTFVSKKRKYPQLNFFFLHSWNNFRVLVDSAAAEFWFSPNKGGPHWAVTPAAAPGRFTLLRWGVADCHLPTLAAFWGKQKSLLKPF